VGIVSGANRGLGLEMALALCEAGARAIYCFDLPATPSDEWTKTQEYVKRMQNGSRLEYVSVDVRDQQVVWGKAHEIGDKEKRMDVCVAAAGILKSHTDCLTYPAEQFKEVRVWVGLVPFQNSIDGYCCEGHGRQHKWCLVYSASGWTTDAPVCQ
jgi:NAD(P)-dependent dehydrogenase (short-subunit alcohol dehydrogenase family)